MCQPFCQFGPWGCTAVRRGPITVPGVIIALYGVVLDPTLAGTYMPTSLLPWLGLLVLALPNMKPIPVAFVLPPLSRTWRCCHIQCRRCLSLCCIARHNRGNGHAFIVATGRPLSTMAFRVWHHCCPLCLSVRYCCHCFASSTEVVKQASAQSQCSRDTLVYVASLSCLVVARGIVAVPSIIPWQLGLQWTGRCSAGIFVSVALASSFALH
jgi:hypothetical protein